MTKWFVSRHTGACEWASNHGVSDATFVRHFNVSAAHPGDIVIGTLPVNLIAEICAQGARYFHLALDLPEDGRGRDLSAAEMDRYGARLVEYRAQEVRAQPTGD